MKKIIAALLAVILSLSVSFVGSAASSDTLKASTEKTDSSYYSYNKKLSASAAEDTVTATAASTDISEGQSADFNFSVNGGRYNVYLKYTVKSVRTDAIEYALLADGKYPFADCESLTAPVYYNEKVKEFLKDGEGNELPSELSLSEEEIIAPVLDDEGIYSEPFSFYFEKGAHTLTVNIKDGAIKLSSVILKPAYEAPSYTEYVKNNPEKTDNKEVLSLNAEHPDKRTSKSVFGFCDSQSASSEPVAGYLTVMNALGGSQWGNVGQNAEWDVKVKKSGWYELRVKYMQSYTNGRSVSRTLYVDGVKPFKEAGDISFPYTGKWSEMTFGNEKGAYSIYLTEGKHTVTLAVSLGSMADIVRECRTVLSDTNAVYRRIITLTGVTPDSYRDYQLDEKIPDTIKQMKDISDSLYNIIERLEKTQTGGTESGVLNRLALQLKRFNKEPEKIAVQLTQFQSNISAFGTWINDRFSQPLAIDELALCGNKAESPFKFSNIIGGLVHGFKQFIYSFTTDYSTIKSGENSIEVWAPTGRDQMQIIKNLTNQKFTPESGINVNLKLIAEAALLPAVVAGEGPDVALMCPQTTPINFAMRNAVVDLSKYEGFKDVSAEMIEDSFIPFTYQDGVYALPETLIFPIMFYRTDILEELELEIPETWDDVTEMVVDLSHNNMQFGFTGSLQNYGTILYQNGGKVYTDDGTASAFDLNESVKAFEIYTTLYRYFKIPVTFEFANRFRNGQMPIAVSEYMSYNTLRIFASEIDGLWSIAPVPGTLGEDGKINRTVVGTATGCIMLNGTKNKNAAWKFMKWWVSAEIQELYGTRVEEKLGASARYATANAIALERLPWSSEFYKELSRQMENVTCIPEVPGGYFTARHFSNAYRKVIYQDENPRETLLEYTKEINAEIKDKREEFGLKTGGKAE